MINGKKSEKLGTKFDGRGKENGYSKTCQVAKSLHYSEVIIESDTKIVVDVIPGFSQYLRKFLRKHREY